MITASPSLALAYRSVETSPSSTLTSQRRVLRLAVFALVTAECTLQFLSSSRSASRKHMGISASDFDNALTSAWAHVIEADTDGLFETQAGLSLGSYGRLRELSGLTTYRAHVLKLTHQALQMAVARSLLVRAIQRIVAEFKTHADHAVRGSNNTGGETIFSSLLEAVSEGENEIRRARSILDLMGAKDSWPVIRATFALCHLATQPSFAVDDVSNTFPLKLMSIGRTSKGMSAEIKKAVARAGSARELSVAGGLGSDMERKSQVALRDKAGPVPVIASPVATTLDRVQPLSSQRAIASDLRAALGPIMRSMHAAGIVLSAANVRAALSSSPLPNIRAGNQILATRIERFHVRSSDAGTQKGTVYEFVVRGQTLSYGYGAFNNTVHKLNKMITKGNSQPG